MHSNNRIPVLYIAGGGHSGSTILSIVLGISKHIFTAGEVKFYGEHTNDELEIWKYIENICMCGRKSKECPFWTVVEARAGRDLDIFHYMTFPQKITTLFDILLPFRHTKKTHAADDDQKLFQVMLDVAHNTKPEATYILDASKSVARLKHLRSHPGYFLGEGRACLHPFLCQSIRQGVFPMDASVGGKQFSYPSIFEEGKDRLLLPRLRYALRAA
jgi:hypothetical protein